MKKLYATINDAHMLLPVNTTGDIECDLNELNSQLEAVICSNDKFRNLVGKSVADRFYISVDLGISDPTLDYSIFNPYFAIISAYIGFEQIGMEIIFATDCQATSNQEEHYDTYLPTLIKKTSNNHSILVAELDFCDSTYTDPKTMLSYDTNKVNGITVEETILEILRDNPIKIRMK